MKALSLFGVLAVAATVQAAPLADTMPAKALLAKAESAAKRDHKKVFVIFHASWCGWCHKLDGMLESESLQSTFDSNYVIVHIDVLENDKNKDLENPGGLKVMDHFGGHNQGLPFWMVLDADGKKIIDSKNPTNIGYPATPAEIAYFMKVVDKTASHMSQGDKDKIADYLKKNGQAAG